jgi:hypothetical protein
VPRERAQRTPLPSVRSADENFSNIAHSALAGSVGSAPMRLLLQSVGPAQLRHAMNGPSSFLAAVLFPPPLAGPLYFRDVHELGTQTSPPIASRILLVDAHTRRAHLCATGNSITIPRCRVTPSRQPSRLLLLLPSILRLLVRA